MVVWDSGSCKGQRWLCGTVVVVRDRGGCVEWKQRERDSWTEVAVRDRDSCVRQK